MTLLTLAPGNFYDGSRTFNTLDVEDGYEYAYRVR